MYPIRERDYWVLQWPGQTVLCVSMTYWTSEVHQAIRLGSDGLSAYLGVCNDQINRTVDLVRGKLSTQNRITLGMIWKRCGSSGLTVSFLVLKGIWITLLYWAVGLGAGGLKCYSYYSKRCIKWNLG